MGAEGDIITSAQETVEVGTDSDGDTISSCVIVEAEPSPYSNSTSRKLPAKANLSLEALSETVLAVGESAPPGFGLPTNIKVVPIDSWREEILRRGIIPADDANPRATFVRIRDQLADRTLIGQRDSLIWKVAS